MSKQITDTVILIRPVAFASNPETQVNNYFQQTSSEMGLSEIRGKAMKEFEGFVKILEDNQINVMVFEDTCSPQKPDSIFPNNWISFHENGEIIIYPMFAPNRRLERRNDILSSLKAQFLVKRIIDLTAAEMQGKYLEGTGSLVLDRENKVAYAALSERTMPDVMADFEKATGFECITFHAYQSKNGQRLPIYHTNVMMYVGEAFVTICLHSIDDPVAREKVKSELFRTGKEIIEISEEQLVHFAGNGLQVANKKGEKLIVMSEAAFRSLTITQINQLENHGRIVYADLSTIEYFGGGSARCMMAEVFLQRNST